MSKYLKGFFNKPGQGKKDPNQPGGEEIPTPSSAQNRKSSDPLDRPFDIDLTDLWKYDVEELSDYIHQYERYFQNVRQHFGGIQKELMTLRERLEITEEEKAALERELAEVRGGGWAKPETINPPKQQTTANLMDFDDEHDAGDKFNFKTLVKKHLNCEKLINSKDLSEIQIASATVMSQLEEMLDDVRNLQKTAWNTIGDLIRGSDIDEEEVIKEGDIDTEDEDKVGGNSQANQGMIGEVSGAGKAELDLLDMDFNADEHGNFKVLPEDSGSKSPFSSKSPSKGINLSKKKANRPKVSTLLGSKVNSKTNSRATTPGLAQIKAHPEEDMYKNLTLSPITPNDPEGVYLLDEKLRGALLYALKHVETETQRHMDNLNRFVQKLRVLEDQASAALASDLESIFPQGPSGGADLQKYSKQLEVYVEELKSKLNEAAEQNKDDKDKSDNPKIVNRKLIDDSKRITEAQLADLRDKLAEEKKRADGLKKQLKSMETENGDIEDNISTLKRENFDALQKAERFEKQLGDAKENEKALQGKLQASEEEINKLTLDLTNANTRAESLERHVEDLERAHNLLTEELRILKEELNSTVSGQQSSEQQTQSELTTMRVEASTLKEEIAKLEKQTTTAESKKMEMENKLIQERLKLENMKRDLVKAQEDHKEARDNLSEQIGKNHDNMRKMENLEGEYTEARKKMKEYRKTARKLSQQILDFQAKLKDEQVLSAQLQNDLSMKASISNVEDPSFNSGEMASKDIKIRDLSSQLNGLLDKTDEYSRTNESLTKKLEEVQEELDKVSRQFNMLKEKREAGVKEIKRLNTIVEQVRSGNTEVALNRLRSEESLPIKAGVLDEVKKSLAGLYKEYMNSIQYDKLEEAQQPSEKKKNIVTSIMLPEAIVKVEKRINDTILAVEEYLHSMTNPTPSVTKAKKKTEV